MNSNFRQFHLAIVRKPGPNFHQGITTSELGQPSYDRILTQHTLYIRTLTSLGLEVVQLEPLPDFPDAYFVEDTAIVFPEFAVITRPGAKARRRETEFIQPEIEKYRKIYFIQPPGILDGGDVLTIGQDIFVGISSRTNEEGANQLNRIVSPYGYQAIPVPVPKGLHLKSSVNWVGRRILLMTPEMTIVEPFKKYEQIIVESHEACAANTLWINHHLIMPKGFPSTRQRLEKIGLPIIELDISEVQKMDGGLTCLSLRLS